MLGKGATRKNACLSILGTCVLEEERAGNKHLQHRVISAIREEMNVLWGHTARGPDGKESCRGFLEKKVTTSTVRKGEQELA